MLVFGSFVGGTPGRAFKWWCWCGACLKDRPQKHIGFPNVQKGQGCSTALVFHNRFHPQRLDVKYVLGGLSSGTFKRVKDALQPLCFTTVSISISHILKSNMSWELVFPNVQKGQGCSTALVFLNLFHLQHLHNNVWGIRENKPPNSKTSGDLSTLNPLYEFAFWCSFLGAS